MYGSIHTQESRDKRQSDAGQVILCTHINNRLKRRSFCCCCCCCCWMTRNDDGDNDDVCAAVTSTVNVSLTRTLIAHLSQYCVRITTTESRRCGDPAGHYTRDVSYSCIVLWLETIRMHHRAVGVGRPAQLICVTTCITVNLEIRQQPSCIRFALRPRRVWLFSPDQSVLIFCLTATQLPQRKR